MGFTLVLGGGGVAGIAWTTGVLFGLAERNAGLDAAERIIGTSAGAVVGAQLLSGTPLEELHARQTNPAQQSAELTPGPPYLENAKRLMRSLRDTRGEARADIVADLLSGAPLAGEQARRSIIAGRLRSHAWPDPRLMVTAVDLETGELRLFDSHAGVELIDAVTASCALPGIWPAPTIHGRRYIDGGVRSGENADVARGARSIIILSPTGLRADDAGGLAGQVAELAAGGSRVLLIEPDSTARAAMGNLLDPSVRAAAGETGRTQGHREAFRVRQLLDSTE